MSVGVLAVSGLIACRITANRTLPFHLGAQVEDTAQIICMTMGFAL